MAGDNYTSTARALALPVPTQESNIETRQAIVRPWSRRSRSTSTHRRSQSFSRSARGFKETWLKNAEKIQRTVYSTVKKMNWWQRIAAVLVLVITAVLGILLVVFNERIFGALVPLSKRWRNMPAGWLIVWALIFTSAFPPLIGFSTSLTIAGFIYGFPNGWFIAASATVVGSLCSFLVSRTLLSGFVHRLVANDKRFAALALTLKHDGLKLLVMIRFCPLPYSLSNGAMSTFPTVSPHSFALATAISTPKLMIHVFIGSRIFDLAEKGAKMDARTKAINYTSIVVGLILGIATGYFIYQRTVTRARQLEAEEIARLREAAADGTLGTFSDDPEEQALDATLLADDDLDSLDDDIGAGNYRDDFTDDDAFEEGDGDDEDDIGLTHQESRNYPK